MSKYNIIVLTGRDNFVWTSMQEIIPMVEHTWVRLCEKQHYKMTLIDVNDSTPTSHLKDLIDSDLIVVTCFNSKIARFIKIFREKLKIDTRLVFYLHGLATIGLWPLSRFEILNLLTNNDIFIATCEGDIKSLNLCFKNAKSLKVPFTLLGALNNSFPNNDQTPFSFIGRISPQKNLDRLIIAYSKLEEDFKAKHPLVIYGKEDHLGFPNLGLQETSYLAKLEKLVSDHNLNKYVVFKGFVERDKIQNKLGSNYIFVSPSTHSDENFGMAAFRALLTGVPCVLSAWGGHKEFSPEFQDQIHYVSPSLTPNGPLIEISDLTKKLIQSIDHNKILKKEYPVKFSEEKIHSLLNSIVESTPHINESLIMTDMAKTIIYQQNHFEKNNEIQRCFKSFTDPAYISLFKAYL